MPKDSRMKMIKYTARWAEDDFYKQYYCTHCGGIAPYMPFESTEELYKQYKAVYCPWCGATMRDDMKKHKVTATAYGVERLWSRDIAAYGGKE